MNIPSIPHKLEQSSGEELANSLSHGIGLIAALVATPFVIQHATQQGNVRSIVGVSIFAATGIILKVSGRMSRPIISTSLYLLMGWLIVIAVNPMYERILSVGLLLLAGGGAAYTAGVAFYVADARLRYGHFIWHLFVMAGTVCHFFAVLWYSA